MSEANRTSEQQGLTNLQNIMKIGLALSSEKNHNRLLEMILQEAMEISAADGGTIYLMTAGDELEFAILLNRTLGMRMGGASGAPIDLPAMPLHDPVTRAPNHRNIATHAALEGVSLNIPDAYDATGFDFSGTRGFDRSNGYRSRSFLTIPMRGNRNDVIGVLQLINAKDTGSGEVVRFTEDVQALCEVLASFAAIALDNQMLIDSHRNLLDAFIRLIADSIDRKSPYTGGHCKRVPVITEMIARAACEDDEGIFRDFSLTEEQWYELHIAAWLHDCGKVVTPVHVLDKATKLETIHDRINEIRARFELLKRDAELSHLKASLAGGADHGRIEREHRAELAAIDGDMAFLEHINIGGEFLDDVQIDRLQQVAGRRLSIGGEVRNLLSEDEVLNLSIRRGTLTESERGIINQHIVHTIEMLEQLPFPKHLRRVPEHAGGHHEKMDGTGYPKGLKREQMSIPSRIMAVADVFEALTALDRPYKQGKMLSESMRIMGRMKAEHHLDPDVFDLFVRKGVYREYALKVLPPELIDPVDEAALLAIQPRPRA